MTAESGSRRVSAPAPRKSARPQDRELRAREQLIEAAREVFERDGFHGARIVDVANAAGVGIGTFYRNFESKSALFRAVIGQVFDEIYAGGSTHSADAADPAAAVELANRRFLEQYRREATMHSLLEQLAPIDEEARQVLSDRASTGRRTHRPLHRVVAGTGLGEPRPGPTSGRRSARGHGQQLRAHLVQPR